MDAAAEAAERERPAAAGDPVESGRGGSQDQVRLKPDRRSDSRRDRGALFVFLEGLENEFSDLVLLRPVVQRPEQREAAALAVDAVLTRRKRHVAPAALAAALPDAEPNQLQSFERPLGEMELGVGELAGRVPFVV